MPPEGDPNQADGVAPEGADGASVRAEDGAAEGRASASVSVDVASQPESVSVDASAAEPGLAEGDEVADAVVGELLATGGFISSWRARRRDGSEATVHALRPDAGDDARDHYLAVASDLAEQQAEQHIEGMLRIAAVDPLAGAYVGDIAPLGTMLDLPVLNWNSEQQFEFLCHLCDTLVRMHEAGIVHGCLRPECVLLDGELHPVLADTQAFDIAGVCESNPEIAEEHRTYTSPQVRAGQVPDEQADVFSVGRLLHFMQLGDHPTEEDSDLPRLDSLAKTPPGLVRIVRRCTTRDHRKRYANAAELRADLDNYAKDQPTGLQHPEIDDLARFSAHPPGGREKVDVSHPAVKLKAGKEADKPRAAPKPDLKRRKVGLHRWTPARGLVFGVVGVLLLVGAVVSAYVSGAESIQLFAVSVAGGALIGLAAPGFGKNRLLSRGLNLALAVTAVWLGDPATYAAKHTPRLDGLSAPKVEERVAAMRELIAEGEDNFSKVNLQGADLTQFNLANLTLDSANLRESICKDADFSNSSMLNVDVTGADFSGAELDGINTSFVIGWTEAKCDNSTTMPTGWVCTDGHPAAPGAQE